MSFHVSVLEWLSRLSKVPRHLPVSKTVRWKEDLWATPTVTNWSQSANFVLGFFPLLETPQPVFCTGIHLQFQFLVEPWTLTFATNWFNHFHFYTEFLFTFHKPPWCLVVWACSPALLLEWASLVRSGAPTEREAQREHRFNAHKRQYGLLLWNIISRGWIRYSETPDPILHYSPPKMRHLANHRPGSSSRSLTLAHTVRDQNQTNNRDRKSLEQL